MILRNIAGVASRNNSKSIRCLHKKACKKTYTGKNTPINPLLIKKGKNICFYPNVSHLLTVYYKAASLLKKISIIN